MTFAQLKESVQDRVNQLGAYCGLGDALRETAARYEEAKAILDLINRVTEISAIEEQERRDHPLMGLPQGWRCDACGSSDPNTPCEAEPDVDRYDPGRC